jgi:hypothetical protein
MDFPPIHLLSSPAIVSASSAFESSLALNRALNDHTLVGTTLNVGVNPATVAVDLAKLSLGIDPTERHAGPIDRVVIAVDLPDAALLAPFQPPKTLHTGTVDRGNAALTTVDPSGNVNLARGVAPREIRSDIELGRVTALARSAAGALGRAMPPQTTLPVGPMPIGPVTGGVR